MFETKEIVSLRRGSEKYSVLKSATMDVERMRAIRKQTMKILK